MWEPGEEKESSRKWEKAEVFYRRRKKDVKMPSIINWSVYKNTVINYWTIHVNSLKDNKVIKKATRVCREQLTSHQTNSFLWQVIDIRSTERRIRGRLYFYHSKGLSLSTWCSRREAESWYGHHQVDKVGWIGFKSAYQWFPTKQKSISSGCDSALGLLNPVVFTVSIVTCIVQ